MLSKDFSEYENFIFDLDGTVWTWDKSIPKAIQVFQVLKRKEKNIFFLTNNTVLTREGFAKKLQNFGINASTSQIINPSLPAKKILKNKRVFCIGEGLITELRRARIKVVESKANAVIVSESRTVNAETMSKACNIITNGVEFYKTAVGGVWVYGKSKKIGSGAIAAAIESCSGKEATLIGKPSQYMLDEVGALSLEPEKTVLFGDECNSDIALGNTLGFKTVLVLTGRDKEKDYLVATGINEPRMVLKSIAKILR